jgi:hypothetical protein
MTARRYERGDTGGIGQAYKKVSGSTVQKSIQKYQLKKGDETNGKNQTN